MTLARKIFSNTMWQVIGKLVTAALGIISIKYVTNYLSTGEYGEYTAIYDFTALFAIVADFGLFTIAVREMAQGQDSEETVIGNILSIRTILAVVSLGLGVLAAALIPAYQGSHIPYGVFIVAVATFITLVAGTMSSVLQIHLKMVKASIALTVGKIVTVAYILMTILYWYPNNPDEGFNHLMLGWIVGGLVTLLMTYRASSKFIKVRYAINTKYWKAVLVKALPYGAALMLGTIYFRTGTITLSLLKMKEQAGLWGVPMRFVEILQIIPHYFMNSVLPILTVSIVQNNKERAAKIMRYAISALHAAAIPTLVGGVILSWPLTAAISGPHFLSFRDAAGTIVWGSDLGLKIMLFAVALTFHHVAFSYALVAMERQKELLWMNAIAVVVNVILNVLLTPHYGFIGSGIAAVSTEAVMCSMLYWRLSRRMTGLLDGIFMLKTLVSTTVMGVVLWIAGLLFHSSLHSISLVVLVPLGGLVYLGCMVLMKAVSRTMLSQLRSSAPAPIDPTQIV